MKHLRKFNESKENEVIDWIKECFLEFSDEEKYDVEFEDNEYIVYLFTGGFNLSKEKPRSIFNVDKHKQNVEYFVEYHQSLLNFYSELDTSIKRVLDKFENMKYDIDLEYVTKGNMNDIDKEYVTIQFYDEEENEDE